MADQPSYSADTSSATLDNPEDMEIVTMVDVLKEEQELEEDAKAVLGASDENNCTYSKGYVKRQALYACVTCIPDAKVDVSKRAGFCLACSYNCHEGHELIELYTKRNFCCDCGNSKFYNNPCKLEPNKTDVNESNTYNHNFCGLYCTCERPYPDPEDSIVDDMIQCVICEDWYHCRHLGVDIPNIGTFSEMTCRDCICKYDFLLYYSALCVTRVFTLNGEDSITIKEEEYSEELNFGDIASQEVSPIAVVCRKPVTKSDIRSAKFWSENWRAQLCTCNNCVRMYNDKKLGFLIESQDTVQAYEEKGKAKALENAGETQYEMGMKALSSLGRVQQVEAISEYNNMRDQLKDYLQKFVENKKVVREEDIREFFSEMEARKKQKVMIPDDCR